MITQTIRKCTSCNEEKTIDKFKTSLKADGSYYIRYKCKTCYNRDNVFYGDQNKKKEYTRRSVKNRNDKLKRAILDFDPLTIARRIKNDSSKSDRNKGLEHDLDTNFILGEIQNDCCYCGQSWKTCRMTLDRVDNNLGHLKTNVVPSCQRCNMVRGNMPYDAWLMVAPGMRAARAAGLLDGWDGPRLNRKTKLVEK